MSRRALLGFLFLNVLVTFATVFVVIKVYSGLAPEGTPRPTAPPLVVLITSTPDPRGTQIAYIVVTATPQSGVPSASDQSGTPSDNSVHGTPVAATAAPGQGSAGGDNSPIPTLDPSLLPARSE